MDLAERIETIYKDIEKMLKQCDDRPDLALKIFEIEQRTDKILAVLTPECDEENE